MSMQESDLLELEKREAIGAFGLTLLNCCLPVFCYVVACLCIP